MKKKASQREVSVEIDKLTNSIVNVISGEIFETEFSKVSKKEIVKKDWLFNWGKELREKQNEVYKMTTVENPNIIQGLVSFKIENNYIFVNLIENAKFNRGKSKLYHGVGGNLFAFACKKSKDLGFEGYISFISKTSLIDYYSKALGAQRAVGQRMVILSTEAEILINRYFKKK